MLNFCCTTSNTFTLTRLIIWCSLTILRYKIADRVDYCLSEINENLFVWIVCPVVFLAQIWLSNFGATVFKYLLYVFILQLSGAQKNGQLMNGLDRYEPTTNVHFTFIDGCSMLY